MGISFLGDSYLCGCTVVWMYILTTKSSKAFPISITLYTLPYVCFYTDLDSMNIAPFPPPPPSPTRLLLHARRRQPHAADAEHRHLPDGALVAAVAGGRGGGQLALRQPRRRGRHLQDQRPGAEVHRHARDRHEEGHGEEHDVREEDIFVSCN